jgi:rubrerythrin
MCGIGQSGCRVYPERHHEKPLRYNEKHDNFKKQGGCQDAEYAIQFTEHINLRSSQMSYDFNAAEVFEMAVRIEENGAAFYRKAADLQEDPSDKNFLETLAHMEDRHKSDFEQMKAAVSDLEKSQTVFDPNEELFIYLKAMADAHVGEGNPNVVDQFTGSETMAEIIQTAIGLEKESIIFYDGLKDLVPPKLGRDKITTIINEEKKHVVQLTGFLKKTQQKI